VAEGPSVLVVGRVAWAVGLVWRAGEDPEASPRAFARAEAKRSGADLFAARGGDGLVVALGERRRGHRPGMPVLALALLERFAGSVLAAFRVEEGVYLLGTRDDQVIAGVEGVRLDEAAARREFLDLAARASWNRLIAPKEWSVPDAEEVPLEEAVADAGEVARLGPIARTREAVLAALALLAALLALLGWWWVEQERVARFLREQNMRLFAEEAARRERREAAQRQEFPPPSWAGRLSFEAALEACLQGLSRLPALLPGWGVALVECDGEVVAKVTYRREGGPVTRFDGVLAGVAPRPRLDWQGNTATVRWTLLPAGAAPPPGAWRADAPTTRLAEAQGEVLRRLEDAGIFQHAVTRQRGREVAILNAEGERVNAVLEEAARIAFTTRLEAVPFLLRLTHGHVSTLRNLAYEPGGGALRVELDVHERLGVPGLRVPGVPQAAPR